MEERIAGDGPVRSGEVPSLPPPCPRSPPEYPDLYGKRREFARVQMLEREIGFLEEELKSVEGLGPASRCCKEVVDFSLGNSDPFIETYQKRSASCVGFWKRLCGIPWLNFSWICCCCYAVCPPDLDLPCRCTCDSCINCCPECPECRCPECRCPECPECRCPNCPECRCPNCPECRCPNCPECRCPNCPECRCPNCPECRCPNCPKCRCPNCPLLKWLCFSCCCLRLRLPECSRQSCCCRNSSCCIPWIPHTCGRCPWNNCRCGRCPWNCSCGSCRPGRCFSRPKCSCVCNKCWCPELPQPCICFSCRDLCCNPCYYCY